MLLFVRFMKLIATTMTMTMTMTMTTTLLLLSTTRSTTSFSFRPSSFQSISRRSNIVVDDINNNNNNNQISTTTPPTSTTTTATHKDRRSFIIIAAAVGGATSSSLIVDLLPNNNNSNNANAAAVPSISEGMSAFASNKVEQSIEIYDSIINDDPRRKPYLWQRGLSLYYAGRYQDGANQFETDVAVNPNDTEEQIWHLLCLSKMEDIGSLNKARLQKLTVGNDRRPIMKLVQKLFLGDDTTELETERTLIEVATAKSDSSNAGAGNRFYASLYLSLYYESLNDEKLSQQYMTNAIETEYARSSGRRDPMVDVAKVAVQRRGWGPTSSSSS